MVLPITYNGNGYNLGTDYGRSYTDDDLTTFANAGMPIPPSIVKDTWLTVGKTDGSTEPELKATNLSKNPGRLHGQYGTTPAMSLTDVSVHYEDPSQGVGGTDPIVVAQISAHVDATSVSFGIEGTTATGETWTCKNVEFNLQ